MTLRRFFPPALKLSVRLARRALDDHRSGAMHRFAGRANNSQAPKSQNHGQITGHTHGGRTIPFPYSFTLEQPVLNATTEESRRNKLHNIRIAARAIEHVTINPGEVFSFWRIVGRPTAKNDFRKGINIIDGVVVEGAGGGLCQLSSIIYHAALRTGVTILERYNHSVDLYSNQERYTPLGSDCTIYYGYKDLRFRNDYPHPIRFRFIVRDQTLHCTLLSTKPLREQSLHFDKSYDDGKTCTVLTKRGANIIARSNYLIGEQKNRKPNAPAPGGIAPGIITSDFDPGRMPTPAHP